MAAVVVWPATAARAPDRLAYGKHGKALRWYIVALYIDWALSCVTIAALLNGPVVHRKLISSKTVQRILDIFYANLDQGRRRIISLPAYSTAEMVRNPPRRILKPYWKTNFFRPRNGHPAPYSVRINRINHRQITP